MVSKTYAHPFTPFMNSMMDDLLVSINGILVPDSFTMFRVCKCHNPIMNRNKFQ